MKYIELENNPAISGIKYYPLTRTLNETWAINHSPLSKTSLPGDIQTANDDTVNKESTFIPMLIKSIKAEFKTFKNLLKAAND